MLARSISPVSHLTLTGGRGRLASLLTGDLRTGGYDTLCLSRSAGDHHVALEDLFANDLLAQTDVLLHLAWSTLPLSSERHQGIEWQTDLPLLHRLLKATAEVQRTRPVHFIFFSSGGTVYGPASNTHPSREDDACAPIGWYGRAKLAAEQLIETFAADQDIPYTILRISNPYGFASPAHKPQGILPFLVASALQGTPFRVWGDGTARKDFLHYTDFLSAVQRVIRERPIGVFNLSSGVSTPIQDVIGMVESATGQTIAKQFGPAHTWDVHDSLLDNTKLRQALNWTPQVDLATGIAEMVDRWSDHP